MEYLPQDYQSNSNKYPLVIFLHGVGERGANSTNPDVLKTTINQVTKLGPPMHVKNGTHFPFILVSPQLKDSYSSWPSSYVMEVLDHLKTYLRIDERRIYVTGLSMGGGGTWTMIQDYPTVFASAAPLCGAGNSTSKACKIASENVAVWGFHGDADDVVSYTKTVNMIDAINACKPAPNPLAKTTIYKGWGHGIWSRAYLTDNSYHTPNLYQFLLQYTKTKIGGNSIPIANAGSDKSTSSSSITLTGSGTDSDGSIASYTWTQISGPSTAKLSGNTTSKLTASSLVKGKYEFRLSVTDNAGNSDADYVTVTVTSSSPAPSNAAPVANAGSDKTIHLPTNSVSITGTGTDSDGSISSYAWTKVSGGAATLSGASSATLKASALVAGTYVFRLTVTDNGGATATDDVKVIVNNPPTVSGGSNKNLTLPTNSVSLYGTASDSDGSIASYSWAKVSGGTATLVNATTEKLTIKDLVAGTYVFRLTVKDDRGASATSDDVTVTVKGGSNAAPVANAGSDKTIHLPTNSVSITGTGTDSDGTISSYAWTKVSGGAATLSGASSATLKASGLVAGSYVFRLTVTDNGGATATDDVKVTVNNPPTVSGGSNKNLTLPTNSVSLYGSASDSDGSIASYSWAKISGGTATLVNATTEKLSLKDLTVGTYVFRLTVKDNLGASATSDDVTVTVKSASNTPPVANAGSDKVIHLPTNSITITGSATDADGSISSYKWTKVSGVTASLSGASTNKLTASSLVAGSYTFRLTVTDNGGATHYDDVVVTVNTPPTVSAGSTIQLTLPTNSVTLTATASDPDGSIQSYAWTKVSGGTASLSGASSSKLSVSQLVAGDYVFRLTVKDNRGASASADVTVKVSSSTAGNKPPAENQPPIVNVGADYKITLPTNSTVIQGTATDPDGSIVSYEWKMTTGTIATLSGTTTNKLTAKNLVAGRYVFRLFATDNNGAKSFDDVLITVLPNPNNIAPTADAGKDIKVILPENSITLQGSGSDPDGTIASWKWSKVSGASVSLSGDETSAVTVSDLKSGEYVFRLTVTDASGATASDDVSVKVNAPPVVNVGENITIYLPTNSVTIQGVASDPDGTIASYNWKMTTGTIGTLSGIETSKLTAKGLVEGSYVFRLYVKDNFGTQSFDDVMVFVKKQVGTASFGESELIARNDEVINDLDNGDNDYWQNKLVTLYDGAGREVYNGRWSRDDYHNYVQPGVLYIYNVMSEGKILRRGKFVRVN